ncbi:MAG: hypothetical protein MUP27_09065 [Desulfobacterales bacterium]|nr:hypothetical protein [Desulfobacterales bacterium]
MKIKKTEFLEALTKVRPGLSEKSLIEQTDHFIFDKDYIRTYNDEVAISYPFQTGFFLAVKADGFYQFISKVSQEEFTLDEKDGSLSISAGKAKAVMVAMQEVKCPTVMIRARRWYPLPKNFSDAIRFCSFSADKNLLSKELSCLWIKDQYVISSDNFRVTKYEMDSKIQTEFLLIASCAQGLAKCKPISYVAEDAWIHFKNEIGLIFSVRVVEGQYPEEVWGLFTMKGDLILIPEGLSESVDRAKVFSGEAVGSSDLIQLRVDSKAGKLFCRGEGSLGWFEEEFKVEYKKKDFEVKVSPEHLIEILAHVKEMQVSNDKLYFGGPNFEHIIALI